MYITMSREIPMRFKDFFYEATIYHKLSDSKPRIILKRPTVIPMPENLKGKRLITFINEDNMYFTCVFDFNTFEPLFMYTGNSDNPYLELVDSAEWTKKMYDKHYTKYDTNMQTFSYKGEARIHPPFEGYVEHPKDVNAWFFTDFESPNAEYNAGDTVATPYVKV